MPTEAPSRKVQSLSLPLERNAFLTAVVRHLSGTLEAAVGLRDASGFVSIVGQRLGDELNREYRTALGTTRLTRAEVAQVAVDLNRRIQGDFFLIEESDDRIVLENRACPHGGKVLGCPSLCMITSNMLGVIAAENLGYSRVVLERTIAKGDPGCRIVMHLKPTSGGRGGEETEFAPLGP